MNKSLTLLIGVFIANTALACDISKEEKLVCEALVCSVGIFIPESHSECLKVQTEFGIYLATLGFWEDPPKCKNRDMNCQAVGNASANISPNICDSVAGNPTDYVNCQIQASKLSGQPFSCSQFEGIQTLMSACEQQFMENGVEANLDGEYILDQNDLRNRL